MIMENKLKKLVGLISKSDLDTFRSFNKVKQEKVIGLLNSGFDFKIIKTYSIWES